jgi:hypothetical protein
MAMRDAANDGNPATAGDLSWTPLLLTAADPFYPGAHTRRPQRDQRGWRGGAV